MSFKPILFGLKNRSAVTHDDHLSWDATAQWLQVLGRLSVTALQGNPVTLAPAAEVVLDFDAGGWQQLALTGTTNFTTDHRRAGVTMEVRLEAGAAPRNLTFPGWSWATAVPSGLGSGQSAWLRLLCWGTTESSVLAVWISPTTAAPVLSEQWRWSNGELQYKFEDGLWYALVPHIREDAKVLAFGEIGVE
jgi:hypothetical protein